MVLPFVRDLFADAEKLPAFARAASHLREGTGRIGVSGLTPTAKALLLVLLQRAADRPLILVVSDNRTSEEFVPLLQAFAELTGSADPATVITLPTRDVLPFQNLSPHPELQEERAVALWRIATGAVSIVVSPITATALRLRSAEYYADLARIVRRGETFDTDPLLRHLNTVGYSSTDVVEMPGEYALRGGILDIFPAEASKPVRVELFGDLIESIRDTQQAITEIDSVSRKQFLEAFQQINENFRKTFTTLFGGGVGEMRLTDETNIAESYRFSRLGILCAGRRRRSHRIRSTPSRSRHYR